MADTKLKRITLRNWMKFRDAEIEFPEKGLVLVMGLNTASRGKMLSSGAGKTGFGEAICRTLLGTTGRFENLRKFSRDKKGDAYVKVETEHRGVPLIIETGYKCAELSKSGEALRYQYGDKKAVERSRMNETRDEIAAILGVSPLLSEWTVLVDGERLKFNQLSQEDSVNLVMAALAQPPWTHLFDRSKKIVNDFKITLENDENNHARAIRAQATAQDDVADAQEAYGAAKEDYDALVKSQKANVDRLTKSTQVKIGRIQPVKDKMAALKKKIEKIEVEKAEQQHKLEIARNDANDNYEAARNKRDDLLEKRASASSVYDAALATLEEMNGAPKVCPTCEKPWDRGHAEAEIKAQDKRVAEAKKKIETTVTNLAVFDAELAKLRQAKQAAQQNLDSLGAAEELTKLSDDYQELEEELDEINGDLHAYELALSEAKQKVSDADVKAAEATLNERKRTLEKADKDVKDYAAAVAENRAALGVVSYWSKAFGPTGIPNMVLSEAIGPLNEVSAAISSRMTGNTIKVDYATTKELASGKEKAHLVINVDNELGSADLEGNSKGERGLTNIIIAETLAEVGHVSNRIGFRWMDEIVPNADPVIQKAVFSYLREAAHRLGTLIFLVEHSPAAESYADHVLLIEKKMDVTSVAWAR